MEQSNVFKKQDTINKSEAVHGDPINAIENVRNLLVSASKSTGEKADAIRLEVKPEHTLPINMCKTIPGG